MSSVTSEDIVNIIRKIDAYDVDCDNLDIKKRLLDQGLDSLDMMNLYFEIEDAFGISVEIEEDDDAEKSWSSIELIIHSIEEAKNV